MTNVTTKLIGNINDSNDNWERVKKNTPKDKDKAMQRRKEMNRKDKMQGTSWLEKQEKKM